MNPAQQEWLTELAKHLMTTGALGAGGAAALGLGRMAMRPFEPVRKPQDPIIVPVPYKAPKEEEPTIKAADVPNPFSPGWWLGANAQNLNDIPARMPASVFGGAGAALGGWAAVSQLLKMKKQKELERDLGNTKEELMTAELGKYKPLDLSKVGEACEAILDGKTPADPAWQKVAVALDRLVQLAATKQANFGSSLGGAYGLYALPAAGVAAVLAHNYARQFNPQLQQAKLLKAQLEEQERDRLPSMYAKFVPVANEEKEKEKIAPPAAPELKAASQLSLEDRARLFVEELLHKRADGLGGMGEAKPSFTPPGVAKPAPPVTVPALGSSPAMQFHPQPGAPNPHFGAAKSPGSFSLSTGTHPLQNAYQTNLMTTPGAAKPMGGIGGAKPAPIPAPTPNPIPALAKASEFQPRPTAVVTPLAPVGEAKMNVGGTPDQVPGEMKPKPPPSTDPTLSRFIGRSQPAAIGTAKPASPLTRNNRYQTAPAPVGAGVAH